MSPVSTISGPPFRPAFGEIVEDVGQVDETAKDAERHGEKRGPAFSAHSTKGGEINHDDIPSPRGKGPPPMREEGHRRRSVRPREEVRPGGSPRVRVERRCLGEGPQPRTVFGSRSCLIVGSCRRRIQVWAKLMTRNSGDTLNIKYSTRWDVFPLRNRLGGKLTKLPSESCIASSGASGGF